MKELTDRQVEIEIDLGKLAAMTAIVEEGLRGAIEKSKTIRVAEVGHAYAFGYMEALTNAISQARVASRRKS